jgi:hypothetical protein
MKKLDLGQAYHVIASIGLVFAIVILSFPNTSSAHHSILGKFDRDKIVEIEGIVTSARWRNPHSQLRLDVLDEESGETTKWVVEAEGLSVLNARGVNRKFVEVGELVKIMGFGSRRGRPEVYGRNLLLSSGREVLLTVTSKEYFSLQENVEMLEAQYDESVELQARRNAEGIFRVWSTDYEDRPFQIYNGNYPILPKAEQIRSQWDPASIDPLSCEPPGTTLLMRSVAPMEFVRQGSNILLRFETNDSVRLIEMAAEPLDRSDTLTLLGRSTGRWDGDILIVKTMNLEANRLDAGGTPHSSSIILVERFIPGQDGNRLDYRLTITDSNTFSEPFSVERHWIWRPEIVVAPFACAADLRD